jgi:branched-chain amino acid transport system permease protein
VAALLALAAAVVPVLSGSDYWLTAILTPFLILSLAGLGLNLLTGYAGQLSVGAAAAMAVGAYTAYNVQARVAGVPVLVSFFAAGLVAALTGIVAGLPSRRVKGFYLVVSSMGLQFLVEWIFTRFGWFSRGNTSGMVGAPPLALFGQALDTPARRYLFTLGLVVALTALARRIVDGEIGRQWMAVRDMDTAAAAIGIRLYRAKLLAFAVSSFYCGVAGALWGLVYLGTFDPRTFEVTRSFQVLFIIIIGGMGSVLGSFIGAAFILVLPILMSVAAGAVVAPILGGSVDQGALENYKKIIFGVLIVFFLIREPEGLARLWRSVTNRWQAWPLRQWPSSEG